MKSKKSKAILLVISVLCLMCFPIQVMADTQQGTNGDELQLMEAQKLEIQLGIEWTGVEFQLKTDAGLYPGTITVGQDGVLRTEIGGSSKYILTCLNSATEVPKPTQGPATKETESNNEPPSSTVDEKENNASGIPVSHILLFAGGMVVAIGALITIRVMKKRREKDFAYEDDDDE